MNQGSNTNIYYTSDKIVALIKKLSSFILHTCKKDLLSFETLTKFWEENQIQLNLYIIRYFGTHTIIKIQHFKIFFWR